MISQELRIGNWVNWKFPNLGYEKNGVVEIERVCQIEGLTSMVHVLGSAYRFNQIEGILLNVDILENLGFETTINNRDSGYKQMGKIVNGHDFMFTVECNHQPEFYFDMVGTEITYLHQLQNLYFSLTGVELTLKTALCTNPKLNQSINTK